MGMGFGLVSVQVGVHVVAVGMGVRMHIGVWVDFAACRRRRRYRLGHPLEHAAQVHETEQNQHHPDRQLQRQPHSGRDDPAEQHDAGSDGQDGQRVAHTPQGADGRRARRGPLAGEDGGHGDHVVGVGRVAHPEEEAEQDHRQEAGHERMVM